MGHNEWGEGHLFTPTRFAWYLWYLGDSIFQVRLSTSDAFSPTAAKLLSTHVANGLEKNGCPLPPS